MARHLDSQEAVDLVLRLHRALALREHVIAVLHGEHKLSLGDAELVRFDRGKTLVEIIAIKIFQRKDKDLTLPLHAGLKVVTEENAWFGGWLKPWTLLSLRLGANPVVYSASER